MADQDALTNMTDEEFRSHVLHVLSRELGLYGYARFLQLYRPGPGDYTRDRHEWLGELSIDEAIAEEEMGRRR